MNTANSSNESKAESENFQPLFVRLRERIKRNGAITFCEWMNAALYEEPDGYYINQNKIRQGRKGDYRTAPEISPLFAQTFARYFATLFEKLDSPKDFTIIECGAGRGAFAFEVLKTLKTQYERVFNSTRYLIDELSKTSREQIKEVLEPFNNRVDFRRLEKNKNCVGVIFSNELIDAFPVHRIVKRGSRLKEIFVGIDSKDDFVLIEKQASETLIGYVERNEINLREGQTIEISLLAEDWLKNISSVLKNGFVITVDYGAEQEELYDFNLRPNGTLRAFQSHKFVDDYLSQIGEVDLTSTINWTALKKTGEEKGLATVSHESLDKFLLRIGLLEQLETVVKIVENESDKIKLRSGVKDLILPFGLGAAQQVLVQKKMGTPSS